MALFLALLACNEQGFSKIADYGGVYESVLTGRVCDPDSGRWLEGALVYTHIITDEGALIDTRETYTDADGNWSLEDMRGDQQYTIYVQYGNVIIDMREVTVDNSEEVEVRTPECGASLGRVAVVSGNYDDWETALPEAGITNYELIDGLAAEELGQFLSDVTNLQEYGAVFFAGGHLEEDVIYDTDGSDADGQVDAVHAAIKAYVAGGGVVLGSDWSYDVIEVLWPNKVDFLGDDEEPDAAQLGEPETVRASIVHEGMVEAVGGDAINVNFDLDTWPLATSVAEGVKVYVRADEVPYRVGTEAYTQDRTPLAFAFTPEEDGGRVIFLSWRVAANLENRGPGILRYLLGD